MNETQHKALMLLGLARKARKLEIGEEPCGIACRSGKAKLLLIAHDAGDAPFAKAFLEGLPELAAQHEDILQELTRQTERVNKRRQEEKAHRKNVRFGKK